MNNTILKTKALLEAKQIDAYTENGCNITPPEGEILYRIDYMNAVDRYEELLIAFDQWVSSK